ncbi:MAG TPA: glycosyltransferase, partial [Mycobacteriales bacterium]|nr:glycosyltransferase [Mycobacteriales bacterium]
MARSMRIFSVYEGFFTGGARILHSEVLIGLQERQNQNFVLSINEVVRREATVQRMKNDACYRALTQTGIVVDSLRPYLKKKSNSARFTRSELMRFEQYAQTADVILSLKEQPLHLVNQADTQGKPVITCLHRSDPENQGPALKELRRAIFSGKVTACICCSQSAKEAYHAAGIPEEKLHVVTNGVDLSRFRFDPYRAAEVRRELEIPADATVVVLAARYDAMKNVPLFLRSARLFLEKTPNARIIMCGAGMSSENPDIVRSIWEIFSNRSELAERINLLSIRRDMEAVYSASDIVALTSSFGETYSLALIEGMMCGAIPVTTAILDSADILRGNGIIAESHPE